MKQILFIAALAFVVLAGCKKDEDVTVATGIKLNVETRTIDIPSTYQLVATVDIISGEPVEGAIITWTSSDPAVATVSSTGSVASKAAGTATITAKAGDKTAECVVTIRFISVTGIALNRPTLLIDDEDVEYKLSATITPSGASDKTITWTSSDEDVATVDKDGVITPLKNGTTTITVTTRDGGKTASCDVTVDIP